MRRPEARVPGISPWSSQEAHPTQGKHMEGQHIHPSQELPFHEHLLCARPGVLSYFTLLDLWGGGGGQDSYFHFAHVETEVQRG